MNTNHPSRDTDSIEAQRRRRGVRWSIGSVVAVLVVTGGFWWRASQPVQFDASLSGSSEPGFAELGQRDEQIRVWHIALDADTGSALVLGQLAALHMQRAREGGGWQDYLTAESFARHSLTRRTNRNGASAVTLVNTLLAQHRFAEARDIAVALVQRESDIPEYRAQLGEVAMEVGDDALANAMFRSVWEQRTQLSMAPRVARWLELTNHVREARQLLQIARDEALGRRNVASETKAWFQLRVGDLELRAGNLRRAEQAYRVGLRIEPGDPRLFSAMARLATAHDNPQQAIAWGERAIGLQLDPATLGLVGDAYALVGDHAKATEYFRTLEIAVATQPGAYHRAWSLYLLDHNLQVATVLAKATAELHDRRDVYGYDLMAWALHKAGRHQEAAVMMQRALRFETPDPLLVRHAQTIAASIAPSRVASR